MRINRKRDVPTESTKGLEDLTKFVNKLIKENSIHSYVYKSFDEEYNQLVYNAGIGIYTSANEVYLKEAELRKKWNIENENTKKEEPEKHSINEQPQLQRSFKSMSKKNSVIIGRVVNEMEIVPVSDKNLGKFAVVVDSKEKNESGEPAFTTYYNVELWNEGYQKKIQKSLKVGEAVMLSGQLAFENYEKDGKKNTSVKVVNPEVTFIGNTKASAENVFIAGRLTKDVEIVNVNNGKGDRVAKFTLAENYGEDKTNFYEVEVWNSKADAAKEHIEKGSLVKVAGNLQIRKYEHNGEEKTSVKVTNAEVDFLSKSASRLEAEKNADGKTAAKFSNNNKGSASK